MLKRFTTFLALVVAVSSLSSVVPHGTAPLLAQNRRVMLEEMTGAWCGWCVRGALAIKQLDEKYPGQVVAVAIHGPLANAEPMATAQGDSLITGKGSADGAIAGYPDGWTARSGSKWDVDPGSWIDTLNGTGVVDNLVGKPTDVAVTVSGVNFDLASQTVTATVTAKFITAQSGDLRFNLYVVEDSIVGQDGPYWDQHNYYWHNATYPTSPYYNLGTEYLYQGQPDGSTIPNYTFNHVFRQAVVGVWGLKGVIPASAAAGSTYSQKFTFPLPDNVSDPNHVNLVGFVHKYSKTSAASNMIFDADQQPLITDKKPRFITDITITANNYSMATANGDTKQTVSFSNNGSDPVTLNLAIDPSMALPAGWSAKISPSSITIDPANVGSADLTVTAPEHSDYVMVKFNAIPVKEGFLTTTYGDTVYMLSNNTVCGFYVSAGTYENAAIAGLPDSLKVHTALIPLDPANYSAFPNTFPITIYNNIAILDNGGIYTNPTVVGDIQASLDAGGKVFINSVSAMYYGLDPNFAQSSSTETQAVLDFYARLGLSSPHSINRYTVNTSGQLTGYKPYPITGTSDPIGAGIVAQNSASAIGPYATEDFSIDSNSVPLFYFDSKSKEIAGACYQDPSTKGKLVYLGFDLGGITVQSKADTIMARSISWLLSDAAAGVATNQPTTGSDLTASSNPFQSITRVTYTAAAGERDVTLSAYDVLGREVAKLNPIAAGDNSFTASFDARNLADGTYTIVAHTTNGTKEIKVVNQK